MAELPPVIPFWMVHGIGKRAPAKLHITIESARQEALRLASLATTTRTMFVVLEAREGFTRSEHDAEIEVVRA